jgi:hypothetical protein
MILLISVSQAIRITGLSHQNPAFFAFFKSSYLWKTKISLHDVNIRNSSRKRNQGDDYEIQGLEYETTSYKMK